MTFTLKHLLTASERSQLAACMTARGPDTPAGLRASLGAFGYRHAGGGRVEITTPRWTQANIVEIDVARDLPGWPVNGQTRQPQRKIYIHRLARLPLILAWREICARGLQARLRTYDGCWVPRFKLWNPANGLSIHTWAAALDVDQNWGLFGAVPRLDPEVVQIFEMFGFHWGGRWSTPDGMHFQWTLPAPGTAPAWQDAALRASSIPVVPALPPRPTVGAAAPTPEPSAPAFVRPPRVFLRGIGAGNTEMDAKTVQYGGGTVTQLDSGALRLVNFTGELGAYFDHAVQLDRLPPEVTL